MNAKKYVSKKEYILLLILAAVAFIFSIAGSISYQNKTDIKRAEYERQQDENLAHNKPVFAGPYCFPDKHPTFLFSITLLLGATFLALCLAKIYFLSFLLTIATLSRFIVWYNKTLELLSEMSDYLKGIERIFHDAGIFDIIVFALISILLFWQISILLRMLIITSQRKNELP